MQSLRARSDSSMYNENFMDIPGRPVCFARSLAGISYEFDEIEPTLAHLELALRSVNEYAPADAVIVAYLTQARIQHLRQDASGALAMLREGQELAEQRGLRRVTLSLAAEECRSLARAGRYEEARLVATRFDFHELPPRSGASPLSSDKALRAASRYLLKQSPRVVVEALDDAIKNSQQREPRSPLGGIADSARPGPKRRRGLGERLGGLASPHSPSRLREIISACSLMKVAN